MQRDVYLRNEDTIPTSVGMSGSSVLILFDDPVRVVPSIGSRRGPLLRDNNGLVDQASMHLNYDWRHANRIGKCIHVQFGFEYISEWESIHLFQPSYLSNLYVVITLLASIRHSCAKLAFYCERVTKSFVGQTDKKYRGAIVLHEICDGRGEIFGLLE